MKMLAWAALAAAGSLLIAADKSTPAKDNRASMERQLMQLERDWNEATIAKDYKTLDRIVADDWTGVDFQGIAVTKPEMLAELKSGESSNQSVQLGELTVKIFGDAAVVMGTDTEQSTYHGKDSSGRYAWMDVFVRRAGRWQAVASQSTKIGD